MKRLFRKNVKRIKGMPSAVLLSILIHAGLFLLAGMLVVFTVVKKEEKKFTPPKAVERPKMKLKKPKVKIKKTSKPKPTTRIVTKMNRASMPDIQLPEMSGMGEGLGGGIGGFDMMPDLGEVGVMGSEYSIGNDFEGRFYSFACDRRGRSIPFSIHSVRTAVKKFMNSGWKPSTLARYYRSPKKLYATTFMIPPTFSTVAPEAFGEGDTKADMWMVHYKGQLVHKEGITFRFCAQADELLVVRVAGEVVMGVAWPSAEQELLATIWSSSSADSRKYWMGNNTAVIGDWITLEPGVPLEMEVLLMDATGGASNYLWGEAAFMLAIEEKGVEYERRMMGGGSTFPAFKTAEPSHDLQDAIYKNLVSGEVSLTNGPVFCDYDSGKREGAPVPRKIDPSLETVPLEELASSDSALRTWNGAGGKTMEAEFVCAIGDKVVLRTAKGKQKKIPLAQLSTEDREYVELANPPRLDIDFSAKTTQMFANLHNASTGITVASDYRAKVRLKQTSAGQYNHELAVELFAIGKEIHGDRYVLLDRQKSCFTPTAENQKSHEFFGRSVKIPDFTQRKLHRGEKPSGYLVTITDSRGQIIQHKASSAWLYENMENLKALPVKAYMDKTCTRVFPTGPKRMLY